MTLDELIAKLTSLRGDSDANGKLKVKLNCTVANVDCWVHDDMVRIEEREERGKVVIMEGGFGA